MRKGLLFSLMTFLLIFSLIIFGQAILKRDLASSQIRVSINTPAKVLALESFISSDVFSTLNLSAPQINRTNSSSQILIYFEKFGELPLKNNGLDKYRQFIQSNFSIRERMNITIDAFSNLTITPINTTIGFSTNETRIYTTNYSRIRSITLTVRVNTSMVVNSSTPSADSRNQTITLNVIDKNGTQVYSGSAIQNPDETNMPFSVFFNNSINSSIQVQFGVVNQRNGTLLIRVNKLLAIPQDLKIALDLIPEEVQIRLNSSIRYYDEASNTQKNSSIVIRRG